MNKISDIRKPGTGKSVERALSALQSEYVIVPRRRVRSWRLWLTVGLVAGVALAIFIIARRSMHNSEEVENKPASYRVSF